MSSERRLYWDSDVIIDLLEQTQARIHRLLPIVTAAKRGSVIIVTSALTMVEVNKLKNLNLLDEQVEQIVMDFFENDYISIRNVDRFVAEKARPIARKCGVKPPDAIQIATAILMEVEVMHTFDGKLLGLSGLVEVEELKIEEPPEPS
jgi:predicted nucleic acid-binding protein